MMPFTGKAHVAYAPVDRVVGLSKLARLVDIYARRLQTQEHLTAQIASAIEDILKPRGVAVMIEAEHTCMSVRGVGKAGSQTITSRFTGLFRTIPPSRPVSCPWCAGAEPPHALAPRFMRPLKRPPRKSLELRPKFDAAGLITCVTTDASTGAVLMVAHMNAEALRKTLRERRGLVFQPFAPQPCGAKVRHRVMFSTG